MKSKKLTIGCRARMLSNDHFKEYKGYEVILTQRSSGYGSFCALVINPKYNGKPLPIKTTGVIENSIAWIHEQNLKLIDSNFNHNITFMDWYACAEDEFCGDCGEYIGDYWVGSNCPNPKCPGNNL